jgi:hypothetical protein
LAKAPAQFRPKWKKTTTPQVRGHDDRKPAHLRGYDHAWGKVRRIKIADKIGEAMVKDIELIPE